MKARIARRCLYTLCVAESFPNKFLTQIPKLILVIRSQRMLLKRPWVYRTIRKKCARMVCEAHQLYDRLKDVKFGYFQGWGLRQRMSVALPAAKEFGVSAGAGKVIPSRSGSVNIR